MRSSAAPTRSAIKQLKDKLKHFIEVDVLLTELVYREVLTHKRMDEVINAPENDAYSRAELLIDCFNGMSEEQCQLFLTALDNTDQRHVANFIKNDGSESTIEVLKIVFTL